MARAPDQTPEGEGHSGKGNGPRSNAVHWLVRVAERARSFPEAFVAVEGQGARAIQRALGLASGAAEADPDDESEAAGPDETESFEIDEDT